jgi:hypothetical protein
MNLALDPAAYQAWLRDPITRAVFAVGEQMARPNVIATQVTEPLASYQLGYYTGAWAILDQLRDLAPPTEFEQDPTYATPESEGD